MQKDLSERRHREGKRNQLKKFKDLHYKEYWKLMDEESDEDHQGNSEIAWGILVNLLS
jgi:CRISPR/Cas system CSM-associated protein Csm4 (group 5 of RAMP superfamily)